MTEPNETRPILRLALAMRGGVSLAVWIGGALRELDRTRHAAGQSDGSFYDQLIELAGYDGLDIDVLAGASAGGLNGVIMAAALATGASVDPLRKVWMDQADMASLVRKPEWKAPPSLLDGRYFHDHIADALRSDFFGKATVGTSLGFDLLLSATLLRPADIHSDEDPNAPVVEHRVEAVLHVRHRPTAGQSDLEPFTTEPGKTSAISLLADAGRSTASFPVAFEPWRIAPDAMGGILRIGLSRREPVFLYDGGVVDNMPVSKAVHAIGQAAADGPTERWLLYLHPSPSVIDHKAEAVDARGEYLSVHLEEDAVPRDLLRSVISSRRGKSLVDDLRMLDDANDETDRLLRRRSQLLQQVLDGGTSALTPTATRADWLADAARIYDLLVNPEGHLDRAPRGAARSARIDRIAETGVRARFAEALDGVPQIEWVPAVLRPDFREAVLDAVEKARSDPKLDGGAGAVPSLSRGSLRPWSPLIRTASLLIEWARHIESENPGAPVGQTKQQLYESREFGMEQATELDLDTLEVMARGTAMLLQGAVESVVPDVIDGRRRLVAGAIASQSLAKSWTALATAALALRTFAQPVEPKANDPSSMLAEALRAGLTGDGKRALSTAEALGVLDALDVALFPQHQGTPLGSMQLIRYRTVAGSARTPLADPSLWSDDPNARALLPTLRTVTPVGHEKPPRSEQLIDPGTKLAGNQFHNFSAFLYRAWRANDWMWGQADAAVTLVDILVTPGRVRRLRKTSSVDDLLESIKGIVTGPIVGLTPAPPPGWADEVLALAQHLWEHEETNIREELDNVAASDELLVACRRVLIGRRHLEVMAQELARTDPLDNPTGQDEADTFADALVAWSEAERSLKSKWRDPKLWLMSAKALVAARALLRRPTVDEPAKPTDPS